MKQNGKKSKESKQERRKRYSNLSTWFKKKTFTIFFKFLNFTLFYYTILSGFAKNIYRIKWMSQFIS